MNWGVNIYLHNLHDHQGHKHIHCLPKFPSTSIIIICARKFFLTVTLWGKYYPHHLDHDEKWASGRSGTGLRSSQRQSHAPDGPRVHAPQGACSLDPLWPPRKTVGFVQEVGLCQSWARAAGYPADRRELGCMMLCEPGKKALSLPRERALWTRCPWVARGTHGELDGPSGSCPSLSARNAFNHRIYSMDLYWYHFQSTAWGVSYVTFTEFEWELYGGEAAWFNLVSPWIFLETFWILCNYTICAFGPSVIVQLAKYSLLITINKGFHFSKKKKKVSEAFHCLKQPEIPTRMFKNKWLRQAHSRQFLSQLHLYCLQTRKAFFTCFVWMCRQR